MSEAERITRALGGHWSGAQGVARCPAHEDRNPSLSLKDGDSGGLLVYCHAGCDFRDVKDALRRDGLLGRDGPSSLPCPARRNRRVTKEGSRADQKSRIARNYYEAAGPIAGTPGETYLRYRGIEGPLPLTLRYIKGCHYRSGLDLPAIIAPIEGARDFGIHRTYLRADGRGKANVDPPKKMLGAAKGGAVRLGQDHGPLIVGDGIETTLSFGSLHVDGPADLRAALSATGLQHLALPDAPGTLCITADGDNEGRKAAQSLAARARLHGWHVTIRPAPDGRDWNDILTGKAVPA